MGLTFPLQNHHRERREKHQGARTTSAVFSHHVLRKLLAPKDGHLAARGGDCISPRLQRGPDIVRAPGVPGAIAPRIQHAISSRGDEIVRAGRGVGGDETDLGGEFLAEFLQR